MAGQGLMRGCLWLVSLIRHALALFQSVLFCSSLRKRSAISQSYPKKKRLYKSSQEDILTIKRYL